jgi:hypothetical protein
MVHAPQADTGALEKLAAELSSRGFNTAIATPDGHLPFLTVTNPAVSHLCEVIIADQGFYWYSWADRISSLDDISTAAASIARVLAASEDRQP